MMRVEEIKGKRQAQYIFDRQKKARQIEKEKDIKEVQRDMVIIHVFGLTCVGRLFRTMVTT